MCGRYSPLLPAAYRVGQRSPRSQLTIPASAPSTQAHRLAVSKYLSSEMLSMTEASSPIQESFDQRYKRTVTAVSKRHDADILLYSGEIDQHGESEVLNAIKERGASRKKNLHLFLTTNGGSPDSAYRIARCLKRAYSKGTFTLVVGWHCKSAGTLLAIGADAIVMSEAAELGPLDTQVQKPDELMELTSGLGAFQALKSLRELALQDFQAHFMKLRLGTGLQLSTKTAADVASRLVIGLLAPVYAQLDPMRLGDNARAILVADEYGSRLGQESLKFGALERLINKYPSHSFVIDREEARECFTSVREPSTEEEEFLDFLDVWARKNADNSSNVMLLTIPTEPSEVGESESKQEASGEREYELPTVPPEGARQQSEQADRGDPGSERVSPEHRSSNQ